MHIRELGSYKCVICGRQKIDEEARDEKPICPWCAGIHNMLESFLEELDIEIKGVQIIDCTTNPFFSFVTDLGLLGTQHPFLASLRQVLGDLQRQVAGKGEISSSALKEAASSKQMHRLLALLKELEMVTLIPEEINGVYVLKSITIPPDSLIHKVSVTTETDPELNRVSTFLLGYLTLRAMCLTLTIIEQKGKIYDGEAITKIYPSGKDDRVMVAKGYTAPISFIFGWWAYEKNEFTEGDLQQFLSLRGLVGKEFRRTLNWFTSAQPGSIHQMFEFDTQQDGLLKFRINPDYQRIRERVRRRARERR